MKNNLTDLLDKIFELEGLVTLSLKRTDIPEELTRLIAKKGQEIADACAKFQEDSISIEENPSPISQIAPITPSSQNIPQDEDFSLSEYAIDDEEPGLLKNASDRGKLIFSINEKFRFRKELFNDSDIDFNNTLALVASMENYDEAEDYFLNEEGFDFRNPVVSEFMDVIKRYFR